MTETASLNEFEPASGFVRDTVSWTVNIPPFVDAEAMKINAALLEEAADLGSFNIHISSEHGAVSERRGRLPLRLLDDPTLQGERIGKGADIARSEITVADYNAVFSRNLFIVLNTPEIIERIQHERGAGDEFDNPSLWAAVYDAILKNELADALKLQRQWISAFAMSGVIFGGSAVALATLGTLPAVVTTAGGMFARAKLRQKQLRSAEPNKVKFFEEINSRKIVTTK